VHTPRAFVVYWQELDRYGYRPSHTPSPHSYQSGKKAREPMHPRGGSIFVFASKQVESARSLQLRRLPRILSIHGCTRTRDSVNIYTRGVRCPESVHQRLLQLKDPVESLPLQFDRKRYHCSSRVLHRVFNLTKQTYINKNEPHSSRPSTPATSPRYKPSRKISR
jgi:hypothetical protein